MVFDTSIRKTLPQGPCWLRYTNDGYGQEDDGSPFTGIGVGRPWPLLTGERAHYELAAGRDISSYLQAMEGFAGTRGLLAEQLWTQRTCHPRHRWSRASRPAPPCLLRGLMRSTSGWSDPH